MIQVYLIKILDRPPFEGCCLDLCFMVVKILPFLQLIIYIPNQILFPHFCLPLTFMHPFNSQLSLSLDSDIEMSGYCLFLPVNSLAISMLILIPY